MKIVLYLGFLIFTSITFAQVSQNSILKIENPKNTLLHSKNSKYSLNLDFIKFHKRSSTSFNIRDTFFGNENDQGSRTKYSMPIIIPQGKFFMKIIPLENNIDFKMDLYDVDEHKYYLRTVG